MNDGDFSAVAIGIELEGPHSRQQFAASQTCPVSHDGGLRRREQGLLFSVALKAYGDARSYVQGRRLLHSAQAVKALQG